MIYKGKWLTNAGKNEREAYVNAGFIVWNPQPTETYNEQELIKMGVVGVLCQPNEARCSISTNGEFEMDAITGHQVKVSGWPYGAPTPDGYYAKCSCGWAGTVHGRETDASEDGKSHQMMYAWESQPPEPERNVYQELLTLFDEEMEKKAKKPTALILWDQAVAVLREDNYQVTQSSRNYATALSSVGLGSPVDEMDNIYNCNCRDCLSKA